MIADGEDAWTIFAFGKRSKVWEMIDLSGNYKAMSTKVMDTDGGWWNFVGTGYEIHNHMPLKVKVKVISTVDTIVTTDDKVLLIERGKEPFKGKWTFPGGRIEHYDKDILSAAKRELKEETSLELDPEYFTTIGNPERDPRGFCLTNVFIVKVDEELNAKAGDDAVNYNWFPLSELPEMVFDHREILNKYLLVRS